MKIFLFHPILRNSMALAIIYACCSTVSAQTYQRNYSTFTEYGTMPRSYEPAPRVVYVPPPEEKKEIDYSDVNTPEADVAYRNMFVRHAYYAGDYDETINLSLEIDPALLGNNIEREKFYSLLINAFVFRNRTKEMVQYVLAAEPGGLIFPDKSFDLLVADQLRGGGYFKEACRYFDRGKTPGVYTKDYQLSYCLVIESIAGREQETQQAYDLLIQNEPGVPLNYYYRGRFLLSQNNPAALADLDQFISMPGEKYDVYFLRAKTHFILENYRQCIADAKEYTKKYKDPNGDELIRQAGLEHEKQLQDPVYAAAVKKIEDEQAAQQKKVELEIAATKKKNEMAAEALRLEQAQQQKQAEREAVLFKEEEKAYYAYIEEHGISESMNEDNSSTGKFTSYYEAIIAGDLKSVYFLWRKGLDINAAYNPYDFASPSYAILDAISNEQYAIADFLLINNSNIQLIDKRNTTLLHLICKVYRYGSNEDELKGPVQIARKLIEKGAELNALNEYGSTPLHSAISAGNYELAKLLLEKGAATDLYDENEKKYPMGIARKYEDKEMIALLKEYKAR